MEDEPIRALERILSGNLHDVATRLRLIRALLRADRPVPARTVYQQLPADQQQAFWDLVGDAEAAGLLALLYGAGESGLVVRI